MARLYLSPSLQDFNLYSGGGNEAYYMGQIADLMEPWLLASGVVTLRSDPETQELLDVIRQSNASGIDLHLALHSNAAGAGKEGTVKGVEVYYDPRSSWSKKAAGFFVDAMKEIYPDPSKVKALPTETLAEVRRVNAPVVLVEVGYHDNPEEAQWIRDNLERIAIALVQGVCAYFGIPVIAPQLPRLAAVSTGGPRLNLRRFPSLSAPIICRIPDGTRVALLSVIPEGTTGYGWSVVGYDDKMGYVKSEYLTILSR